MNILSCREGLHGEELLQCLRNDAIGMQYLIPGWVFDNKKPCMVR